MKDVLTGAALVMAVGVVLALVADRLWLYVAVGIDLSALFVYGVGIIIVESLVIARQAYHDWRVSALRIQRLARHSSPPRVDVPDAAEQPEDAPIGMRDIVPW